MTLKRDFKIQVLGKIDGSVSRVAILAGGPGESKLGSPAKAGRKRGAWLDEFCRVLPAYLP